MRNAEDYDELAAGAKWSRREQLLMTLRIPHSAFDSNPSSP